ncbi:MAG: Uma2 family endonuclease [Cyanobacteria bacterium Co-bin8]|nr:Uma2 family endonuclease [Cyanobacteria bacterium Co-bin8]
MVQSPTKTLATWSLDDYHRMIEAGILADRQVELLNGEIVEMPPEGPPHAYFSGGLADFLRDALRERAQIREAKPITLLLSQSEPEPDIAVVRRLETVYRERHPYPEDIFWAIEFSNSSLNKDLEDKRRVYAAAGIPEYWVVNLKKNLLVVFREPVEGDYGSKQTFSQGEIRPLAFPEVVIPMSRILA